MRNPQRFLSDEHKIFFFFCRHDRKSVSRWKPSGASISNPDYQVSKLPTQQFGASLEWIRVNNNDQLIPPIMNICMDFLSKPDNLETEGIFRKSGNASQIKELMAKINNGERIVFSQGDVHIAAVILKTFLKELEEPLLTFKLYENIISIESVPKDDRLVIIKSILEQLPPQNYVVLQHLVEFLSLVSILHENFAKPFKLFFNQSVKNCT